MTTAAMHLYNAIENCVDLINENGGFTILGWYKRGSMNDKGLTNSGNENTNSNTNHNNNNESAVQVDAGDISLHIVNIIPTNRDFLDNTTALGGRLHNLKFDPTTIESSS